MENRNLYNSLLTREKLGIVKTLVSSEYLLGDLRYRALLSKEGGEEVKMFEDIAEKHLYFQRILVIHAIEYYKEYAKHFSLNGTEYKEVKEELKEALEKERDYFKGGFPSTDVITTMFTNMIDEFLEQI